MPRHYSPAMQAMMAGGTWDSGDPFGSGMEFGWALAIVGRAIDHPAPAQILNVRPSPLVPRYTLPEIMEAGAGDDEVNLPMVDLAQAVRYGLVTPDDLTFAARALNRYVALCIRHGKGR